MAAIVPALPITPALIAPGIERIDHPAWSIRLANNWLVGGILIEPTVTADGLAWVKWVEKNPGRVKAVLITHWHIDHFFRLHFLQHEFNWDIFGPIPSSDFVPGYFRYAALKGGDTFHGWSVLHTPGHEPEHLCFWKDRTLILGDMLEQDREVVVPKIGGDKAQYQKSLQMLSDLPIDLALPGHGPEIYSPCDLLKSRKGA